MPRLSNKNFETFNDGVLNVYKMKNRKKGNLVLTLRYGDKTVGIKPYLDAKILSEQIDKKVAVPIIGSISQMDLIEIGEKQYSIFQIQEKFDAKPPCSYLHLKELKVKVNE